MAAVWEHPVVVWGLWKLFSAFWDASGSFFVDSRANFQLLEESAGAGFEPGTSHLIIVLATLLTVNKVAISPY